MSENAGEQAGEPDQPPGEESGTYRGEGVGRREQVDSGPATGRPGDPHPPTVRASGGTTGDSGYGGDDVSSPDSDVVGDGSPPTGA